MYEHCCVRDRRGKGGGAVAGARKANKQSTRFSERNCVDARGRETFPPFGAVPSEQLSLK
jgi:hypothetical protein